MGTGKLYKYLDFNGGLMMMYNSNLQFTNATQLNDPFDCHPSLIDFSNVPKEACEGWTPEIIEELKGNHFVELERRHGYAVFLKFIIQF